MRKRDPDKAARLPDGRLRTLYLDTELPILPKGYRAWRIDRKDGTYFALTRAAADRCAREGGGTVSVFRDGPVLTYYNE